MRINTRLVTISLMLSNYVADDLKNVYSLYSL